MYVFISLPSVLMLNVTDMTNVTERIHYGFYILSVVSQRSMTVLGGEHMLQTEIAVSFVWFR